MTIYLAWVHGQALETDFRCSLITSCISVSHTRNTFGLKERRQTHNSPNQDCKIHKVVSL